MDASQQSLSLAILIPAFNEGARLDATLTRIMGFMEYVKEHVYRTISQVALVVVDDGSSAPIDVSPSVEPSGAVQVWLLRHAVNLGQGAALCTATAFARDHLASNVFVTMDADGQHDPADLPTLLNALITTNADIVFGNRFSGDHSQVPPLRRALLKAATGFERFISGLNLSDAHNGFRAFGGRTADLIDFQQNRMAHATEIKQIVHRNHLRYCEVPVSIRYSAETLAKGQRSSGSLVILRDLLSAYLFRA
jgi:glycosyltransferase involved in cell wall biosynthesis